MAHMFKISVSRSDCHAVFNGFCAGLMYDAFNHPECNAGLSGTGAKFLITKDAAVAGLQRAIARYSVYSVYTDDRISEIRTFAECMQDDPAWTTYEIQFL